MAIQVTTSELKAQIGAGLTKAEIAAYFQISPAAASQFAKQIGMKFKIKRKVDPKYILVDDSNITETPYSVDSLNKQLANN
jgi:hypothetical protein